MKNSASEGDEVPQSTQHRGSSLLRASLGLVGATGGPRVFVQLGLPALAPLRRHPDVVPLFPPVQLPDEHWYPLLGVPQPRRPRLGCGHAVWQGQVLCVERKVPGPGHRLLFLTLSSLFLLSFLLPVRGQVELRVALPRMGLSCSENLPVLRAVGILQGVEPLKNFLVPALCAERPVLERAFLAQPAHLA